jgi:hypothetical protein
MTRNPAKQAYFWIPGQARNDEVEHWIPGQARNDEVEHWIPGQARNDVTRIWVVIYPLRKQDILPIYLKIEERK